MASTNVTVVGPHRAADLTLPVTVPLGILLPEIVRLLAPQPPTSHPAAWTLTRSVGGVLDLQATVADNRVGQGDVLVLTDRAQAAPEPTVRDLVEAVEDAADGIRRWSPAATRVVAAATALVTGLALAGGVAVAAPATWPAVVALAGATVALLVAVRLAGGRLERWPAALFVVGVILVGANVGRVSAAVPGQPGATALALAGAGALVAAAGARWASRTAALPAMTLGVVAVAALAGGLAMRAGASAGAVAAVAGYAALLANGPVPWAATALAGLPRLDDTVTAQASHQVDRRVAASTAYVTALLTGTALVVVAGIAVLAVTGGPFAIALAALLSAGLLLGARSFSAVANVVPLAGAGVVGLAAVEWGALSAPGVPRISAVVGPVAVVVCAVLVALLRPSRVAGVRRKRWLDRLETLVLVLCPALILGLVDAYGYAVRLLS